MQGRDDIEHKAAHVRSDGMVASMKDVDDHGPTVELLTGKVGTWRELSFVGGDGLGAFSLDGREVIQLRGYPNQSLSSNDGNTIYNKFSLELRYPITLKQLASIYALTFAEAGQSYDGFRNYNPFDVNRSAGVGLRIFMPAFGLLGIDFGYGFDPVLGGTEPNGWETHFIIGQQF